MKARWIVAVVLGLLVVGLVAQATLAAPRGIGWGPGGMMGGGFGMMGGFGGMMGGGMMGGGTMGGNLVYIVADALGMDANDVYTLRSEGKSFYEIAKSKGVSEKDLLDKVIAYHKQYLDQSVKNGFLTQQQADQMLQIMTERFDSSLSWTTGGAGFGCGGFGPRGFWGNSQGNSQNSFRGNQPSGFRGMMGPGFWGSSVNQ